MANFRSNECTFYFRSKDSAEAKRENSQEERGGRGGYYRERVQERLSLTRVLKLNVAISPRNEAISSRN